MTETNSPRRNIAVSWKACAIFHKIRKRAQSPLIFIISIIPYTPPLLSTRNPFFLFHTIFLIWLQNGIKLLKRSSQNTTIFIFLKFFVFSIKKYFYRWWDFVPQKSFRRSVQHKNDSFRSSDALHPSMLLGNPCASIIHAFLLSSLSRCFHSPVIHKKYPRKNARIF